MCFAPPLLEYGCAEGQCLTFKPIREWCRQWDKVDSVGSEPWGIWMMSAHWGCANTIVHLPLRLGQSWQTSVERINPLAKENKHSMCHSGFSSYKEMSNGSKYLKGIIFLKTRPKQSISSNRVSESIVRNEVISQVDHFPLFIWRDCPKQLSSF